MSPPVPGTRWSSLRSSCAAPGAAAGASPLTSIVSPSCASVSSTMSSSVSPVDRREADLVVLRLRRRASRRSAPSSLNRPVASVFTASLPCPRRSPSRHAPAGRARRSRGRVIVAMGRRRRLAGAGAGRSGQAGSGAWRGLLVPVLAARAGAGCGSGRRQASSTKARRRSCMRSAPGVATAVPRDAHRCDAELQAAAARRSDSAGIT